MRVDFWWKGCSPPCGGRAASRVLACWDEGLGRGGLGCSLGGVRGFRDPGLRTSSASIIANSGVGGLELGVPQKKVHSHGARPVHRIISMIKWIRASRLSIQISLSALRVLYYRRWVVPGKGDSNSHGVRPIHLIITKIKWFRASRLSIKKSLSAGYRGRETVE